MDGAPFVDWGFSKPRGPHYDTHSLSLPLLGSRGIWGARATNVSTALTLSSVPGVTHRTNPGRVLAALLPNPQVWKTDLAVAVAAAVPAPLGCLTGRSFAFFFSSFFFRLLTWKINSHSDP